MMKSRYMIALGVLGAFFVYTMSSFSEDEGDQYLSFQAAYFNHIGMRIHIIDENGAFEEIEMNGAPGMRNYIEWKKFIWNKVNEVAARGYEIEEGGFDHHDGGSKVPGCQFTFVKK